MEFPEVGDTGPPKPEGLAGGSKPDEFGCVLPELWLVLGFKHVHNRTLGTYIDDMLLRMFERPPLKGCGYERELKGTCVAVG